MTSTARDIEQHPDIAALRMRYDRAAETMPAQIVAGLGFLSGLYLALSPWVCGFNDLDPAKANNLLVGIAMAVLSLGFASAFGRTHGLAWVAPLIGVWTIVSPWVLRGNVDTTKVITNNVILGAVFLLIGAGAMAIGMQRARH